jgi:hypothetical protein
MPSTPAPAPSAKARRVRAFTTATVVSFSLTLLAGSIAVLSSMVPLKALSLAERVDLSALLFMAPLLALILAVVFETTRIAFKREPLPAPRRQQVVRGWVPGRREG